MTYIGSPSVRAQQCSPGTPRSVAASAPSAGLAHVARLYDIEASALSESGAVDMLGIPIAPLPEPVRLTRGKPPEQWSKQERDDAALWQLGPAFRAGLRPPPGGESVYVPSPDDHSYYDSATGEWRPK